MKKILLDTNFLLIPSQFKVDIFAEIDRIILENYKIYILDKTVDELNSIIRDKRQKLKNRNAAKLGLQLIKAQKINMIKTKENLPVDDLLMKQKGYIIATQDIALKRRLKDKKIKIIILRQKNRLILK